MSGTGPPPTGSEGSPGWAPPAGAYPAGQHVQAAPAAGESYQRLAGLSPWIFWLLLLVGASYALGALITLATPGLGDYTTPATVDDYGGGDAALALIAFLQGLLSIAVAVLFIIWFYRAYRNLRTIGTRRPRRAVGWTIGAWFVPLLNLVLPKLMLDEAWRSSDPDAESGSAGSAVPAYHHLWWVVWVVAFLLSIALGVESGISSFDAALEGDGETAASANGALAFVSNALYAVAAVLGALVVRRSTERQEQRARRLGWVPA